MRLTFSIAAGGDATRVVLAGAIDEHASPILTDCAKRVKDEPRVAVDCQGITFINSTGIKAWVAFLRAARRQSEVRLEACSPYFLDYALMSPTLVEIVPIASVRLSFKCTACGATHEETVATAHDPVSHARVATCPHCASRSTVDTDLESLAEVLAASGAR